MTAAVPRVVLATRNAGKLNEMQAMFADLPFELVAQGELDIPSAPEDATTFVENALAKARFVAARTGCPAIADDSGLTVPALNGAPGIYSARFAGPDATDEQNNTKLLAALQSIESPRAFFYCAMVFLTHAQDPTPLIATGQWWGEIIDTPRGENGFGYDPLFYIPALGKTSAELSPSEKNRISHRALAAAALRNLLKQ